jgi:integrase
MTYAFARIGAVVSMRVEDYFANGKRWWVRLHEKGGKRHEMPAHHKLEAFLDEYIRTAGIAGEERSPLFRSGVRRTGTLAATAMHRVDAWRMIQRRAAELGTKVKIGCHTFRATGITTYLEAVVCARDRKTGRPRRRSGLLKCLFGRSGRWRPGWEVEFWREAVTIIVWSQVLHDAGSRCER